MIARPLRTWIALLSLMMMSLGASAQAEVLPADINTGGYVMMIRHAYAPGNGDPANFVIGDCTTQRNLNDEGRRQSRDIGAWLNQAGVTGARVYSSQWCRCMETAELMDIGQVTELPALNSFYERPQDREPNLRALRQFLDSLPAQGPLTVLVTHYVTISAMADTGVSSGNGVLLVGQGDGRRVLKRVSLF